MSAGCSKEHNRPSAAVRRLRRSLPRWPPICSRHNVVDRHGSCICCGRPRQGGGFVHADQRRLVIRTNRISKTCTGYRPLTKRFQHVYRVFSDALCWAAQLKRWAQEAESRMRICRAEKRRKSCSCRPESGFMAISLCVRRHEDKTQISWRVSRSLQHSLHSIIVSLIQYLGYRQRPGTREPAVFRTSRVRLTLF